MRRPRRRRRRASFLVAGAALVALNVITQQQTQTALPELKMKLSMVVVSVELCIYHEAAGAQHGDEVG